jgi:hypothetical protein
LDFWISWDGWKVGTDTLEGYRLHVLLENKGNASAERAEALVWMPVEVIAPQARETMPNTVWYPIILSNESRSFREGVIGLIKPQLQL